MKNISSRKSFSEDTEVFYTVRDDTWMSEVDETSWVMCSSGMSPRVWVGSLTTCLKLNCSRSSHKCWDAGNSGSSSWRLKLLMMIIWEFLASSCSRLHCLVHWRILLWGIWSLVSKQMVHGPVDVESVRRNNSKVDVLELIGILYYS